MSKVVDIVGQKFGMLTVLELFKKDNRLYCRCKCDCGNETTVRKDSLKIIKSCGCLQQKTQFKSVDVAGEKFGRLTAKKPTEKRDKHNGSVIWICECECGNVVEVPEYLLTRQDVKSCGCLEEENRKIQGRKAGALHIKNNIINDTNVQALKVKLRSDNKSGVKGVTWDKSRNKWLAQIRFKKEHYFLGRFDQIDDAIAIRKEAEEKLHGEFLEWYVGMIADGVAGVENKIDDNSLLVGFSWVGSLSNDELLKFKHLVERELIERLDEIETIHVELDDLNKVKSLESFISLDEYAAMNGISGGYARQKARRGGFETAVKIGAHWVIDKNEVNKDNRVTSGKYKNWRKPKDSAP